MSFVKQGAFLLNARTKRGVNQARMAGDLGLTAQFYGRCENGQVGLPIVHLYKFLLLTGAKGSDFEKALLEDIKKTFREEMAHEDYLANRREREKADRRRDHA